MDAPLTTTEDFIVAAGGTGAVARQMGVSPQVVTNWRSKDKFPAHTYLALKAVFEKQGLTVPDDLWRMRSRATSFPHSPNHCEG